MCKGTKQPNSTPLTKEHCLISCIYSAVIHSGWMPVIAKSAVVNVVSSASPRKSAALALSPPVIKRAVDPTKTTMISSAGSLKCHNCNGEAHSTCSSIVASRGSNSREDVVLQISERIICTCNDERCISEARKKRNGDATRNWKGVGFVSFRCAVEPIQDRQKIEDSIIEEPFATPRVSFSVDRDGDAEETSNYNMNIERKNPVIDTEEKGCIEQSDIMLYDGEELDEGDIPGMKSNIEQPFSFDPIELETIINDIEDRGYMRESVLMYNEEELEEGEIPEY